MNKIKEFINSVLYPRTLLLRGVAAVLDLALGVVLWSEDFKVIGTVMVVFAAYHVAKGLEGLRS